MPALAVGSSLGSGLAVPLRPALHPGRSPACRDNAQKRVRHPDRAATAARSCGRARRRLAAAAAAAAPAAGDLDVDVCILGAGILGLCSALVLLREDEHLKVALLDREVPCSGATGAGASGRWNAPVAVNHSCPCCPTRPNASLTGWMQARGTCGCATATWAPPPLRWRLAASRCGRSCWHPLCPSCPSKQWSGRWAHAWGCCSTAAFRVPQQRAQLVFSNVSSLQCMPLPVYGPGPRRWHPHF